MTPSPHAPRTCTAAPGRRAQAARSRVSGSAFLWVPTRVGLVAFMTLCVGLLVDARAEKADRQQPLTIEADQSSTVDVARRVVVFNGRVVLTQGTLRILADRIEVSDMGEGHRTAQARGRPEQPALFREKRDGVEEFVEGRADLIEYDSREALIRLSGKAVVRRLRGTQLADEVQGETIVWNGNRETFSVTPGTRVGADGRTDRVRGVFAPPPPTGAQGGNPGPAEPAPTAAPRR